MGKKKNNGFELELNSNLRTIAVAMYMIAAFLMIMAGIIIKK